MKPKQLTAIGALFSLIVATSAAFAAQGDKPAAWTPELSMEVKNVTGVRVSPDAQRVAYVVTRPIMTADKSENLSQIYVASADGSNTFQLTRADKSSTNPQWSPDGNTLAFTSTRSGKSNIFVIRVSGGEPEQITDVKTGVGSFSWSPDGNSIAFVQTDPQTDDEEKAGKGKDDWRWVEENVKQNQLYVASLAKDTHGKREPRKLTKKSYNVEGAFDWSPDGQAIVFSHTRSPKADHWTTADVSVVDVASGEVEELLSSPAAESQPLYSRDGKWIAVVVSDSPPTWGGAERINVVSAKGGAPKTLAATFDEQPVLIGWAADGQRIYFNEARGTTTRIYSVNIDTNVIDETNRADGVYGGISLNRAGTMFGFSKQTPDTPPEAFVCKVHDFTPVQISRENAGLSKPPLGKTEVIRWKSADGMEIEGLLSYPVGYESGKKVPLLLVIHGGPTGVFVQNFIGGPNPYPTASFTSRGYAVLRANPRGSSGYGKKFRYANYKDWGGGDFKDLMAGVDFVVHLGIADPNRLGVMGWSYGGFMTSWVITQTNRFKAASIGAPVTNLVSFTGTSDIPGFIPDYMGAQSWDNLEMYRAHSPMFNIKGVSTPALIQHGEADIRVPISQGYELYNALKSQGVSTRMLVLPRQPHGPNEPKMLLKVMKTNLDWFNEHLNGGS